MTTPETTTTMYRTTRFIWYIFYVIETILALRFVLRLLSANQGAGFTNFVYGVSGFLLAPFRFVFGTPSFGGSALELSTLLAMVVYWLIAWGIVKLVAMNRTVHPVEAQENLKVQDQA